MIFVFRRCYHVTPVLQGWGKSAAVPITTPQKVLRRHGKKSTKKRELVRNAKETHLVISCKRRKFNHYAGNTYGNGRSEPIDLKYLASGGWLHYKSKGDYFTINPHAKANLVDETLTFTDLGISDRITELLAGQNIIHPSPVQVDTIPPITGLCNVICAGDTGSGKTLAYLLPLVQHLSKYPKRPKSDEPSPNAVIVAPSRELVQQITSVAEALCLPLGIPVMSLCGEQQNSKLIRELRMFSKDVQLIVATPGSILDFLSAGAISASRLNHIVIDEADTLMDNSFCGSTLSLIRRLSANQSGIQGTQIILVSATMPRDTNTLLRNVMNVAGFVKCTTENLHHALPHISQKFVRLGCQQKPEYIMQQLRGNNKKPTLVFTKSCGTAEFLHGFLTENNIDNLILHGKMNALDRRGKFESFQQGESDLLVCSDIASRGLDTKRAELIINYDMARFMSDYIHRVGRVGRLGSKSGTVLNMIGHRHEVKLVWEIEQAVRAAGFKVALLPNVNANIKKQYQQRHAP